MNNLDVMERIMNEKDKEITATGSVPMDAEIKALAEGKRFTFDVIAVPTDPLR